MSHAMKARGGVQGFSTPDVDRCIWAADDKHQGHEVRAYLTSLGIEFTPMLGSYVHDDGRRAVELAYYTTWDDYLRVAHLCEAQESVLWLGGKDSHNRHKAVLRYADGREVDLGRMYSVALDAATKRTAWSVPLDGKRDGELVAFVCDHIDKFGQPIVG